MTQPTAAGPALPKLGYHPALDGLRAVAITFVIAAHLGIHPAEGGVIGVYMFFVLSGFLITTLLIEEHGDSGRICLRRFYIRRALRLFPALLVVAAATDLYVFFDHGNPVRSPTLRSTLPVLFYYANWEWFAHGAAATSLGWFGHMWSLAIEEQFYLIWPLFLILVFRRGWRARRVVPALLLAAILSLILRIIPMPGIEGSFSGTPMVAEMLLWGALLAFLLKSSKADLATRWAARLRWPAAGCIGLFLVTAPTGRVNAAIMDGPGLSLVSIATAIIITAVATDPVSLMARLLSARPITFLGGISYAMYLWHILVCFTLSEHVSFKHHTHPLYWLLGYVLTVLVAVASRRLIEVPFLRLKDTRSLRAGGDVVVNQRLPHNARVRSSLALRAIQRRERGQIEVEE